jgi:hypothetical protein
LKLQGRRRQWPKCIEIEVDRSWGRQSDTLKQGRALLLFGEVNEAAKTPL